MSTPIELSAIGPAAIMTIVCALAYCAVGFIREAELRRIWRRAALHLTIIWASVLVIVVILGFIAWSVQNSI